MPRAGKRNCPLALSDGFAAQGGLPPLHAAHSARGGQFRLFGQPTGAWLGLWPKNGTVRDGYVNGYRAKNGAFIVA